MYNACNVYMFHKYLVTHVPTTLILKVLVLYLLSTLYKKINHVEIFNNLTKICEAQSMMFSVTTIAGGAVGIFTIVVTVILFALLAYKCFKTKSSTIAHNNVCLASAWHSLV